MATAAVAEAGRVGAGHAAAMVTADRRAVTTTDVRLGAMTIDPEVDRAIVTGAAIGVAGAITTARSVAMVTVTAVRHRPAARTAIGR